MDVLCWLANTELLRFTEPAISHFNGLAEALSFQLLRRRNLFFVPGASGSDPGGAFIARPRPGAYCAVLSSGQCQNVFRWIENPF